MCTHMHAYSYTLPYIHAYIHVPYYINLRKKLPNLTYNDRHRTMIWDKFLELKERTHDMMHTRCPN